MKHIPWPSIEQFRNVVKHVTHQTAYVGVDENGEPIFDKSRKAPTLKFEGTVKLHGTNAGFARSPNGEFWCQSRTNIITPMHDNAGFAMFIEGRKEIAESIIETTHIVTDRADKTVIVFGEYCGGNIQKGVAISQLDKMFVVFGIALVDEYGNKDYLTAKQVSSIMSGHTGNRYQIYNIWQFQSFEVDIDFDQPHLIQNELNELTKLVEEKCPVGFSFGIEGIGEGIVWRCVTPRYEDSVYWFKVKGEKHSNTKVKTLANVDVDRISDIQILAHTLANNGRLEQGCQIVFDTLNGGEVDLKKMGDMIKWTMSDIFKEELDTIAASGFTGKDLNSPICKIVRDFVMSKLEF